MIYVRKISNYTLIHKAICHPRVAKFFFGDLPKQLQRYDQYRFPLVLGCYEDEQYLGACVFEIRNSNTLEIHVAFLPEAYGSRALHAGLEVVKWVWCNTSFQRINATVGISNRLAIALAMKCGFKACGYFAKGHTIDGSPEDQIVLGLLRGE